MAESLCCLPVFVSEVGDVFSDLASEGATSAAAIASLRVERDERERERERDAMRQIDLGFATECPWFLVDIKDLVWCLGAAPAAPEVEPRKVKKNFGEGWFRCQLSGDDFAVGTNHRLAGGQHLLKGPGVF